MNAMVAFRANRVGTFSPTPEERQAALEQVWSMARATLLGRAGIQPKSAIQSTPQGTQAITSRADIDRQAFLRLLVLQMQAQDPFEPVSNAEMLAQLAQFSVLDEVSQLNQRFDRLTTALTSQNFVAASNLLGLTISGTTRDGIPVSGVVERVFLDNGQVFIEVGDMTIPLSNLTEVKPHEESTHQ